MDMTQLGIIVGVAIIGGLSAMAIMLKLHFPIAWVRKLTHVGGTTFIIVSALLTNYKVFVIAGFIFAALIMLMRFIRPPKALAKAETLYSFGESFFFIGVALTALLADSTLHFVIPIAILGFADTAAYIVGRSIKSPTLIFSKTVAGSLAFVLVAFLLLLIVAPWWVAVIGAVVTGTAELVGLRGSDNVTVPVVAALLLTIA